MLGEIRPEEKKVEWQIDFNYLAGEIYNASVEGSVGNGQEIDENSFRIYTDTVDSTGKPDKTNADSTLVNPADLGIRFEVSPDKKSFKVHFHDGVTQKMINAPYRIVYDGKMVGERLTKYDSQSTVHFQDKGGKKLNIPLKAEVSKTENINTFVSKGGKAVENTDLIEWTITLNEAYSDISKLKVIDTYSPGLRLLKDGFELYDDKGVLVAEGQDFFDNWFELVEPNPGEDSTVFHLIFREGPGKMITKKMQIKYHTQLVEGKLKSNTVTNQVTLEGALRKDAVKESQAQVLQRYYDISIDESSVNRQMKIVKVNEKGEPMAGVEFRVELKRPDGVTVVGTFKTGSDGTALVEKLRQNLTYDLVEVKAPEGYELAAPKQFTVTAANDVNKGGKPLEVKVVNQPKSAVPQPSVPADPNQPTAPTDPTPSQPTDPTQPTTPTTPTQPTTPTEPTQPAPDATGGIGTEPTTTTNGDRTRGDLPIQPEDLVEVSTPPENGTVTIVDGGWEYIPLGVPTKDSFVVTIVRPDGSKETVEIDIVPENIPQGGLPITGQLPEWLFYVSGALVVLMGVAVRFFNRRA
ncbi:MAG: collagen binding domain-containing protein [Bacillota bacterium]|nr:collagen binding domain-containing protein [Bacillota bacterium]